MTKYLQTVAAVFVVALAAPAIVRTQEKPAAPAAANPAPAAKVDPFLIPIKLSVVISRFQGEKKISSLPYTLSVGLTGSSNGNRATLRMGAKVPVMMMMTTNMPKDVPQGGPIQYQDVGTNIDCFVFGGREDGRFRVDITIEDTSVYGDGPTATDYKPAAGNPSFRSFKASDSMVLRDGQTSQFTTATDKVSGEIVKVDVTLTVVK